MSSSTAYRHAGRTWFPPVIFDMIIERVAGGESVATICEDQSMPSKSTVYNAISEDPLLSKRFADATRTAVEKRAKQSA
ncbi:hypothetical protein SBC1_31470 [Caballeronia sp. SBC1]|uniref:terminase small subunit-like protein n=1 Tax=Caballeronia sp. SBC1 TaxID=2705548 RepID=UPI0014091C66|nr:hypothetical protein [Caballeronia sp. SBC1]QIN63123.1 hypothetical protein SBC1_31470 [Caballeronia sp. SBC1]